MTETAGPSGSAIDDNQPLLQQLAHLGPAEYQAWLLRTSRGRARFFASSTLEALTKVKWWAVPLLWLPVAALLAWKALAGGTPPQLAGGLAAAGVLLWQLIEYSLHRWLFHAVPSTPAAIIAHFLMHGNHHKFPSDVERLVFPPLPACLPAALIYGTLRFSLPQAVAAAVFSGVLLGYVGYDCLHYLMHRCVLLGYVGYDCLHYLMHSGHLRGSLRARHMHHHYADGATAYGISSPLWDAVFGTQPRLAKVP